MDLKNGKITLGELLKNPKARELVEREAPGVTTSPLAGRFRAMPLERAVALLRPIMNSNRLDALLRELETL